ncbi:MAG: GHMP kinase [Nanoarchaeota archaeon]|nr:GHMP kinase [Nanoarchaeota archaeon]
MRVASRAPMRIEFGGGGTDIPSFSDKYGGVVLNATINKYIYTTLQPSHGTDLKVITTETDKSILFKDAKDLVYNGDSDLIKAIIRRMKVNYGSEIYMRSEAPPESGLGSGSAISVAMVGLFNHLRHNQKFNNYQIAENAYEIMRDELNVQGGKQSFYSAAFGGFNTIEFMENGFVRVNPLKLKNNTLADLEKHLLLVYVGQKDKGVTSQNIIKKQESKYGEQQGVALLEKLKGLALDMQDSIQNSDLERFGMLMNTAFETKKVLQPQITNKRIEAISNLVLKNGALSSRIQGAGGGGHMLVLCNPNKEHNVMKALLEKGIHTVPYSFTNKGLEIWEASD